MPPPDSLESDTRTVSVLTLVSRITGLLRDAALSRVFGAGPLMSAFFFAFLVPNLFRRLFGEGALASAFLPNYSQALRDDPAAAKALASMTVATLTSALGILTIVIELILAGWLSAQDEINPAVVLLMIMLPYMPLVCLVAVLGAMLQTHGRFGPTAAAPMILNLCVVAATLGLASVFDADDYNASLTHAGIVGGSIVFAGVLQLSWSLLALRRLRWWTKERSQPARAAFRRMLLLAGPMILSLGVLQFNTFLDGLIASYPVTFNTDAIFGYDYPLDRSAMAVIGFGQRLYQFPLGVFGIAVATAIFPLLASQASDGEAFISTLRRGLRLVMFIGLPASAGLVLVHEPLTRVIYEGGRFDPAETARVGRVLLGYAPAIWAYSMTHVLIRAFYAQHDARRPMRIAICIVMLNVALNCVLIWFLAEVGLAVSTAICAVIQVGALLIASRYHAPGLLDRSVLKSWGKTLIITAIMSLAVFGITVLIGDPSNWIGALGLLFALTATGILAVSIAAMILRMPELRWAIGSRSSS